MTISIHIQELWKKFETMPFPQGYGGVEIEDIDLALLETNTAGCIHTFVHHGGSLDAWRIDILSDCYRDLTLITQQLDGDAKDFFICMKNLAYLILEETKGKSEISSDL